MSELDSLDYYALLGITRDARPDDVRAAFHRHAQLHHPDRHVRSPLEVRIEAQRWYRRGAEAYRVLMNPEQRAAYDVMLARGTLRFDPTVARPLASMRPAAPDVLVTTQSRARPFLAKALDALRKEEWASAKLNLQLVLQYDPDNEAVRAKLEELASRATR